MPPDPEKTFQRCLSTRARRSREPANAFAAAHITSSDGRRPFTEAEEDAVLEVVRAKRVWPAFKGTASSIGIKGFRSYGYHEKLRYKLNDASNAGAAPPPPQQQQQPQQRRQARGQAAQPPAKRLELAEAPAQREVSYAQPPQPPAPPPGYSAQYSPPWAMWPPPYYLQQHVHGLLQTPALAPASSPFPADLFPADADAHALASDEQWLVSIVFPAMVRMAYAPSGAPPEPGVNEAWAALSRFEERHAGHAIVAVNPMAKAVETLLLAQNAASVDVLGEVAQNVHGAFRPLIPHTDFVSFAKHMLYCLRTARDRDVELACRVRVVTPNHGDGVLLRLVMAYDSTAGVLLISGAV